MMMLDFKQNKNNQTLHITLFEENGNCCVKQAKLILTKENIEYFEWVGCWLPIITLEELIRELFGCRTDADYNRALTWVDEKEFNELLLKLDFKFKNLNWS